MLKLETWKAIPELENNYQLNKCGWLSISM